MENEKKKELGLFDLVSLGVGSVIGAGVFSMLGVGIALTGRSVALAMVLAMFTVYIQNIRMPFMASMFDLEGGQYAQTALVLSKPLIGVSAVNTLINNLVFSMFGVSIAAYLAQLLPALEPFQTLIALLIITLAFASSVKGSKFMARIQNVMVVCMYAALILFTVFGIMKSNVSAYAGEAYLIDGIPGFMMAMALTSFTCYGAANLVNLAHDAKNPKKIIPLSILLTTVVCAALYFLLAFASTSALPYSELAGQNLGYVAERIMPSGMYIFFVLGGAVFALATSLIGGIAALRYPVFSSAQDGWLPKIFTKTTRDGFPWAITLLIYVFAIVPVILGFSLDSIVSLILVPTGVVSFCTNLACLKLPKQYPEEWENSSMKCPYWLYCTVMVLSAVICVVVSIFSLMSQSKGMIIGNIVLTIVIFAYGILRSRSDQVQLRSVENVRK